MRILACFALLLPTLANAQTASTFGGVGSRAEGMAGAFVAVADDASAIYWNPAGLAWPTGATFDAQFWVGGAGDGPMPSFFGIGTPPLGLSYYRIHKSVGLATVPAPEDRKNEGSGVVQVRTLTTSNFGITVLQTFVERLVIGSTVRLVRGAVEGFQGTTKVDVDAGAMVSAGDVRLGLTARNIRQPAFEGEDGPVRLRRAFRVGAAFAPRSLRAGAHGPFTLAFDADLTAAEAPFGDDREASVGGEYWLLQGRFGTRAGVRWSTLKRGNRAVSGGLTVKLPRSLFAECHVTKLNESEGIEWGIGTRVTF
jgi:hypothetical protein